MFFKGSRYEKVPVSTFVDASRREIRFKTTRFKSSRQSVDGISKGRK